jgi:hypothetical protein
MELYSKVNEQTREHYLPAFEALDELIATISTTETGTPFGDIEA